MPGGANSGLAGRILFGHEREDPGWLLDLSTGHYRKVAGTDVEYYPGCDDARGDDFSVIPNQQGDRFVVTVKDCSYLSDFDWEHLIVVLDETGNELSRFMLEATSGDVQNATLSPDGNLIAVLYSDGRYYDEENRILLVDLQGNPVGEPGSHEVTGPLVEWLPDNRLLYASGQSLYITEPNSTEGRQFVSFDEEEGYPADVAVSPDGSRVALSLRAENTYSQYGSPWVIDLDTLEQTKLAHYDDPFQEDGVGRIEDPTWSPDGEYIALMAGSDRWGITVPAVVTPAPDGPRSDGALLFVVPADSRDVLLDESVEGVRAVRSYYVEADPHTGDGGEFGTDIYFNFGMYWIR
ncbi:MAG: hypothetical protein CSB44_01280 [Gammaproteobacteria bacterium]|nr:MAG: hypothetical protein CSB44_01280 [Gammaproteobacteria bacterium]